jgi:hypothetical protein
LRAGWRAPTFFGVPPPDDVVHPRRPPAPVALVARTHWVVGGTIVAGAVLLRWMMAKFPVDFSLRTYTITAALAALYLLAGTLVWFGVPPGRLLSRICGLIYLARPSLGSFLWDIMDSEEFKTHFRRRRAPPAL